MEIIKLISIYVVAVLFAGGIVYIAFSTPAQVSVDTEDTQTCVAFPKELSQKTVIMRVDDIQAYTWKETSIKMLEDAVALDIPLTLGIIPIGFLEDVELVEALKKHSCNMEFALHGWDHNAGPDGLQPEFVELSKSEALERLKPGLAVVSELSGQPVSLWIPPQNVQSTGTVEALTELGITRISAEGSGIFDYDATTYDYGVSELVMPAQVIATCEQVFQTKTTCVIMLHPQDFATGDVHEKEKYQRYYLDLLTLLKEREYTFARFAEI